MKPRALAYALSFGSLWCFAAAAQQLPRFDIEATCKGAHALTKEDSNPAQGCVRDETDAQHQLQAIWSSTAAANRETCAQEAQIGGSPSYVDMLTCVQMREGTLSSTPPRQRRQP
ncbi:hypothetical protein [Microvirga massiliensis]|uniref:hypothetical protein n=1 Tax=Microvirga massiliensis TaxID=1033741 RepID=UPI00062B465F|nr:hypothetical protein [Microvirga massiliensis]